MLFTRFLLPLCWTCSSPPSLRTSLLCSRDLHWGSQPFSRIRALDPTWGWLRNREAQADRFAGSLTQGLHFFSGLTRSRHGQFAEALSSLGEKQKVPAAGGEGPARGRPPFLTQSQPKMLLFEPVAFHGIFTKIKSQHHVHLLRNTHHESSACLALLRLWPLQCGLRSGWLEGRDHPALRVVLPCEQAVLSTAQP